MKRDLINDAIKYLSSDNLKKLNKKYGTNYTKNELFIDDKIDKGKPEVFCVHVTDLHYGKITPSYSPDVCMSRVIQLTRTLELLSGIEHRSRNFSSFTILDTGDMLDGFGIYPTQSAGHVEPDMNKQVFEVIERFYKPLIEFGLANFPKVDIYKVPGNHGRMGKHHSEASNFDVMVTNILKMVYADNPRVKIEGSAQCIRVFNVEGHDVLLMHGDSKRMIRYHGLPWYGVEDTASTLASNFSGGFDVACMGHIHQWAMVPLKYGVNKMCLVSGTMVSDDDFSIKNYSKDGVRTWWAFGLHPNRKQPSFMYPVDLKDLE